MIFDATDIERTRSPEFSLEEWQIRLELAACYRVFKHKGWSEEIFNHITAKVPGPDQHYLINPFGLTYNEVTASNLIKVDLQGRAVSPTNHVVNRAGFVIHSAIHGARDDAHCIMHTHTSAGLAVACKAGGLSFDNFYASFLRDELAYHDFEGVSVNEDEGPRMVANLGRKTCLIMRNHGLLVAHRSIASAYFWMHLLQRACEIQVMSGCIPGPNIPISDAAMQISSRGADKTDPAGDLSNKLFSAAARNAHVVIDDLL